MRTAASLTASAALVGFVMAASLAGCATPLARFDPKVVKAHPLPSYQIHEECFKLDEGERVDFRFESTEPVAFNIHYHEGHAVVMPISREKSLEYAGVYVARLDQDYCLMWEAGAAGAVIDYWIQFKRAP